MPPLRDHVEDLEEIIAALLDELNVKHQTAVKRIDEEVLQEFRHYPWPGNVRELRNAIERALVTGPGEILMKKDLAPDFGRQAPLAAGDGLQLRAGMSVSEAERRLIQQTLEFTENNKTRAAELLGISLKTLHNKLKEYESQP